jgi:hypothetical protein
VLRRPHRVALAAATLLGVLACQGGRRAPPPERFVPARAAAAAVVPELARAARELGILHATLSRFPGAGELPGARGALAAQLGFDPLDPKALEDAGLDPRGGLAVASLAEGAGGVEGARHVLVVLPVADASRVEGLLARLARDRLGATERSSERHGGTAVTVLRAPGARAPALAYVIASRTALLCTGPASPAAVAEAAALAAGASLAEHPAWKVARRALGDGVAAVQWTPPGSPLLRGLRLIEDGFALGLSAPEGRLAARAAVLLGAREPSFRALAADGAGARLVTALDPAAPLVARWDGDFAALGAKLLPLLSAAERARLEARGVDLARDLFAQLAPGGVVALSLPPALDVGGLSADAARADPLRALAFEAVLPVKDPRAAEAASLRLSALGVGGAPPSSPQGGVHRFRTGSGEVAWRIDVEKRRVVAAGGAPGRLEALEARLAKGDGWRPPTRGAEGALAEGLGGAVLDPARLLAAVRALPEETFGTGPSRFVVRSLVGRVLEPAARLAAVTARAELAAGALLVHLEVEARPETRP